MTEGSELLEWIERHPLRATTRAPGEGEPVAWWVTHQQPGEPYKATRMKRVAEIWAERGLEVTCLYAAPPALAAPSYAQPAPRASAAVEEQQDGWNSDFYIVQLRAVEARATAAEAREAKLTKALEFYADGKNWSRGRWPDDDDIIEGIICIDWQTYDEHDIPFADCGDIARAALAKEPGG